MADHQAPPSLGFSRQEYWSGLPFPSPLIKPKLFLNKLLETTTVYFLTAIYFPQQSNYFPQVLKWIKRSHAYEYTLPRSYPLKNFQTHKEINVWSISIKEHLV